MRPWALAAMLVLGAPARTAPAAAPRPAETSPTLCAMAVDPGLALIEVRFDQLRRMDSWSWCGGGENYPEITGTPHFRDAHTAVLPVRLRPRHTYSLSINCFSGQGFRAVTGEAAVPSPLLFTTTAAPGRFTVSDPLNAKSWVEFRRLFDTVYSHRATGPPSFARPHRGCSTPPPPTSLRCACRCCSAAPRTFTCASSAPTAPRSSAAAPHRIDK